jgi:hypothetical protein
MVATYPDADDGQRRGRAARTAVKGGGRSGGEGLGIYCEGTVATYPDTDDV